MSKRTLLIILIFLVAFGLRCYRLGEIPPGLTHDEANHGREALGILDGVFLFFFPLNYGSEPLYSYTLAGSVLAIGRNLLGLRWVNVVFGLLAIGVTYAWAARAFGRRTALLAAALLAISFWPLASSRQALRAGMLPFFVGMGVWFFWKMVGENGDGGRGTGDGGRGIGRWSIGDWGVVVGFGVSVAVTLHIYLAARVAWLVFPGFLVYLALVHRPVFRRVWKATLAGLALAGLLVVPMFLYLERHPEALTRLEMLDRPLQDLQAGRLGPVVQNAGEALLAFVWPGYGDAFLAYNIPGRPVFDAVTALFFVLGIFVSLWRWRQPAHAFLLIWFGIGIAPSLVTGATANGTRNLAALGAVYLLPAVGFMGLTTSQAIRRLRFKGPVPAGMAVLWLLFAGFTTGRDYFVRWGESAEVRGAYQHTLVEILDYLEAVNDTLDAADTSIVVSSVYPGAAHDPSIGLVLAAEASRPDRWIDARYALLIPPEPGTWLVVPDSTPLHPAFKPLLQPVERVRLRPDDLDPGFTLYARAADPPALWPATENVTFGEAVSLLHAGWLEPSVPAGATAELLMVWRVLDPERVGPVVPPAYTTDVVMFTQLLDGSGNVLAQRDSLEAPSWGWQRGDLVVQVHPVVIPADAGIGLTPAIVGIYDRQSGERLPVVDEDGNVVGTSASVESLKIGD